MKRLLLIAAMALSVEMATAPLALAQTQGYVSMPPLPRQRGNIANQLNQQELGPIAADSGMVSAEPQPSVQQPYPAPVYSGYGPYAAYTNYGPTIPYGGAAYPPYGVPYYSYGYAYPYAGGPYFYDGSPYYGYAPVAAGLGWGWGRGGWHGGGWHGGGWHGGGRHGGSHGGGGRGSHR